MDNPATDFCPNVIVRHGRSRKQWGEVVGQVPVPHDSPEPTVVVRHGPRSQLWTALGSSQEAFAEIRPLQAFSPDARSFGHSLAPSHSAFSIGSAAFPEESAHFHDSYECGSLSRRSHLDWMDGDGSIRDDPSTATNGQTTAASGTTLGCSERSIAAACARREEPVLSHLKLDLVSQWAESALGEADSLPLSPVESLANQTATIRLDPNERIVSSEGLQMFNCNGMLLPMPPSTTTPRLMTAASMFENLSSPVNRRSCTVSPSPQPLSPSGSIRSIIPSGSQTATPRSSKRTVQCPSGAASAWSQSPALHPLARGGVTDGACSLPPSPQAFALSPVLPGRIPSTSISPCTPNLFPPNVAQEWNLKVQVGGALCGAKPARGKKPRV